jgi:hypothetical protein
MSAYSERSMTSEAASAQIVRFEDECLRLEEMLRDFEHEKKSTRWTPLVGVVLAVPSVLLAPWAPYLVLVCAAVVMGVWRYLIFGHVNERTFQLEMAREEVQRLRAGGMLDASQDEMKPEESAHAFPAKSGVKPLQLWQKR